MQEPRAVKVEEYAPLVEFGGRWEPWRETVGFVIRGLTLRRMRYPRNYQHRRLGDFYVVEFDIQDGCGGYHATGFWAVDVRRL
jgi:hypothetical protein